MLSNQPSPTNTSNEVVAPSTFNRLRALLSLVAGNPSTLEPLLMEVRNTKFFIPTEASPVPSPLSDISLFCTEREGKAFTISFLKEADAKEYFQDETEPFQLMLCRGDHLLETLGRRELPLGLYIVDNGQGYYLNSQIVDIGRSILDFEDAEVSKVQYAPMPFSGTISRELLTELKLFCSQHKHIERLYLCEIQASSGAVEPTLIIVGDHMASPVNVQELLSVIAANAHIPNWKGSIMWIGPGEGEDTLMQNEIDQVYAKKK